MAACGQLKSAPSERARGRAADAHGLSARARTVRGREAASRICPIRSMSTISGRNHDVLNGRDGQQENEQAE